MPAIEVTNSYRFTATTTAQEFIVPPNRSVVVVHRGLAADGTTASTGHLHADCAGGVPLANNADGEGLHTILSGESYPMILPRDETSFQIRAASADTLIQILIGGSTLR